MPDKQFRFYVSLMVSMRNLEEELQKLDTLLKDIYTDGESLPRVCRRELWTAKTTRKTLGDGVKELRKMRDKIEAVAFEDIP